MNTIRVESGKEFVRKLKAISKIVPEVFFVFDDDIAKIVAIDKARVVLIDWDITEDSDVFVEIQENGKYKIAIDEVAKWLYSNMKKNDTVEIVFDEDDVMFKLIKESGYVFKVFESYIVDGEEFEEIPEFTNEEEVFVEDPAVLKKFVSSVKKPEEVTITLNEHGGVISIYASSGREFTMSLGTPVEKEITVRLAPNYLKDVLDVYGRDEVVIGFVGTDSPVQFDDDLAGLRIVIAPRVMTV